MNEKEAIAIIGGADGPTSIFIAGKIGAGDIILGVLLVVAVVGLAVWLWKRRK